MGKWGSLIVLATAQFLMVLDQAVMNVSISQLVEDFDTTVTAIQGVITLYSLVMAAFMLTGGKIGDLVGRRRAFGIGLSIYAVGSGLTAVSWSVGSLALGWSVLEGLGAALVLPALVALIAGNYEGRDRVVAYGVIGGVAGAGIAVGPILGGWFTTTLTWRLVFVGEVVVALAILVALRWVGDAPGPRRRPQLDVVGSVLSAAGLGLVVFGILQSSTWGWLAPKNSPIEPFGFALTPFVVASGGFVLWAFAAWERRREEQGRDPLVHLALLSIPRLRSGLQTFLAQNAILLGVFFIIPLYLQMVLGLDALETGLRMLPASLTMFVTSMAGSRLASRFSARTIIRTGLGLLFAAIALLLGTIEPSLDGPAFSWAMAVLGIGMGLVASQLGNVVQSSVGPEARSEAGGLQYTAQQMGSALGVALIGAIVLTGLSQTFVNRVTNDERISAEVQEEVSVAVTEGVSFVSSSSVRDAAADAGLEDESIDALVESYEESQIFALKAGLLAAAAIVGLSFFATGDLPASKDDLFTPDAPGRAEPVT